MGAAETKAGHEDEHVDGTSAAPWPLLDGVRPRTSSALDDRRSEDGEGRGGAKSNTAMVGHFYVRAVRPSNSNVGRPTRSGAKVRCLRLTDGFQRHPMVSVEFLEERPGCHGNKI